MRPKPDLAPTCVVGQPWQFRFHPGPTASAMPKPVRAQVRCETSSCRHAKRMVFSYGSNSLQQLQGRLQAELFSFPAVADGVFLAFAGAIQSWAVEDAEVVSTATHFGRNVPNKFAVGGADMLSPILQHKMVLHLLSSGLSADLRQQRMERLYCSAMLRS